MDKEQNPWDYIFFATIYWNRHFCQCPLRIPISKKLKIRTCPAVSLLSPAPSVWC